MIRRVAAERGGRKVILLDSISRVEAGDAGHIVVAASHGGASAGEFAAPHRLAAAFFNDAGVGKDEAGIAALAMLQKLRVPAATVSYLSARIGDAEDMWQHGIVSHLNAAAARRGLEAGEKLRDAVDKLLA